MTVKLVTRIHCDHDGRGPYNPCGMTVYVETDQPLAARTKAEAGGWTSVGALIFCPSHGQKSTARKAKKAPLNTTEINQLVQWAKDQDNAPMVAGGHRIARIEDGHYVCECDRVGGPVKPGDPPLEVLKARGF